MCTVGQVPYGEGIFNLAAGLAGTPALQAGVLLLRGLQHVVTTQALREEYMSALMCAEILLSVSTNEPMCQIAIEQ